MEKLPKGLWPTWKNCWFPGERAGPSVLFCLCRKIGSPLAHLSAISKRLYRLSRPFRLPLFSLPVAKLKTAISVLRELGPSWALFRVRYALRLRSGALVRRTPVKAWTDLAPAEFLAPSVPSEPAALAARLRKDAPPFFFSAKDFPLWRSRLTRWDAVTAAPLSPVAETANLLCGHPTLFSHFASNAGARPDWHRDPVGKTVWPATEHWSTINAFALGDVKGVWELGRFGWVFPLVRTHARTGDLRPAETFWSLFDDFCAKNPPNAGPHWMCGQECAFRLFGFLFGYRAFLDTPAATPARLLQALRFVHAHADRISANLDYALSQKNNHGLSECVGLITAGLMFPQLAGASGWVQEGVSALKAQVEELCYVDGGFAQHSVNYHRVMVHDLVWAAKLLKINKKDSTWLEAALARSAVFQASLIAGSGGETPNWGANDGALILPLSNSAYRDFRPCAQLAAAVAEQPLPFGSGPWNEPLLWMGCTANLEAAASESHKSSQLVLPSEFILKLPVNPREVAKQTRVPFARRLSSPFLETREGFHFPPATRFREAGLHLLRGEHSRAYFRICDQFKHRPHHADALHVDLWWKGLNIALDAGTFSYNAAAPWDTGLKETAVHNTVGVDDLDQMDKASRFLWSGWTKGEIIREGPCLDGLGRTLVARHLGYRRLNTFFNPALGVVHRRAVIGLPGDRWIVLDRLASRSLHHYKLHWLLRDDPGARLAKDGSVMLQTPAGPYRVIARCLHPDAAPELVRADPKSTRGWNSTHYLKKEPALSFSLQSTGRNSVVFATLFTPRPDDNLRLSETEVVFNLDKPVHATLAVLLD